MQRKHASTGYQASVRCAEQHAEDALDLLLHDAAAVARSDAVEKILQAACKLTGMRFAAVARVTRQRWLACAVRDDLEFGLQVGDELEVASTLCFEVGECGRTIVIDHVAEDPIYWDHHTPKQYGFQSYISTPILRQGEFFGTLCALDPNPAKPSDPAVRATFELFAELIGSHLDSDAKLDRTTALIELSDRSRDVDDPGELSFIAAEVLGRTLDVDRSGYATVDAASEAAVVERDWTAPGIESLAGTHQFRHYGSFIDDLKRGEDVVFADAELDARTSDRGGPMSNIAARAIVNIPIIEQGKLVALLYLHSAAPRQWTETELAFVREVAERTRSVIERRRAERDLKHLAETLESQVLERTTELRRYNDIVEATVAPICAFDRDLRLIAFNRAHNEEFRRVNGFETKLGDIFPDLFIPEQQPIMRALMKRALTGEVFTVTGEFGRPELGTPVWEITYTPLRNDEGEVVGAFHHATDISERLLAEADLRSAQEALRQSQKMEAMGSLTGGVAHDFNNLLTPILGSLDLLQRKGVGSEREQRLIDGALQSAERAKTLVQRLLAFARRQPLQSSAVDVKVLVESMADLLSSTTGPQVRVAVDVADQLSPAKADPNQLEMALLNLGVNARDAMPNGGTLHIAATQETLNEARGELGAGEYIQLSVTDTGMGMDEPTRARAIEPFFSTKGIGKGTGLGLSMAHGLAAQLGGALTIESQLGMGTTIKLWLPTSPAPIFSDQPAAETIYLNNHQGLALLVDDEDHVRASVADMLSDLGFRVEEVTSAENALSLVSNGLRPDILVTDHLMPGMSGLDLIHALRRNLPELPALIVSGYAEDGGITPDLPRLTKPFRSNELAEKLGDLLQRKASVS